MVISGKSPFLEGKICTDSTCQDEHFAAFLLCSVTGIGTFTGRRSLEMRFCFGTGTLGGKNSEGSSLSSCSG